MVKGIIKTRGSGKTKELIEFAAETGATIVCENPDRMIAKIHGYEKTGIRVISYGDFMVQSETDNTTKYCIDELENFCEYLNISAFTFVKD